MLADFRKLMAARFLFTFAVAMQAVIMGWRMYTLMHDPLYLGFIGLAEAVPALGLALFAGYIVDRRKPLPIYRCVVGGSLLSGLILLFSQSGFFALSVSAQVLWLFASSVVTGTARAFSQPSLYATVPRLVPREELSRASAWMTSALQIARISGPGIGGILYGYIGIESATIVLCVALVLAQVSLALIRTPVPASAVAKSGRGSIRQELLLGMTYVYNHPVLFSALSLDMLSVLFGGVTAILPIYAADILHVGARGLGLLRAAPALGAALVSIGMTRLDARERAGTWLFASVTGFGVSILVFGVSHSFVLSLVTLGLSGGFDSVSMVIRSAAVQLASPDSMRGRISAVNSIFIGSSNELGEFESGVAARFLGTVPSVVFGGVICLATVFAAAVLSPALRRLDLRNLKAT